MLTKRAACSLVHVISLSGSPMSQGVVEGKVRVAQTFEEAHLIQVTTHCLVLELKLS